MLELSSVVEFIRTSPELIRDGAGIVRSDSLQEEDLIRLSLGKICAIHVPGYFSGSSAQTASERILNSTAEERNYLDISYRILNPKRLSMEDEKLKAEYYSTSLQKNRDLRHLFFPVTSPLDTLRLELDELWPSGAGILRDEGKLNVAGSVRYMNSDTFLKNIPGGYKHIDAQHLPGQRVFSACLYLKVPPENGDLRIWDVMGETNPNHPALKYCNSVEPDIQNVLQEIFPEPLTVKVEAGDLVIFDTGRPHVVTPFHTGERLCLQSFLICRGIHHPIEFSA